MTFIIGNFQFYCKIGKKRHKIKQDISKFGSIFPNLQSVTVFGPLKVYLKNKK